MNKAGDTVCKLCCFAEWDKDEETQIGCELGIIEGARKAGVPVLEAFDDDKAFYVVQSKQCMYHRPLSWAKDKDNPKDYAEKELYMPFEALVLMDEDTTLEEIQYSIDCLGSQELLPYYVVVIRPHLNRVRPTEINDYLNTKGFQMWKTEGPTKEQCFMKDGRRLMDLPLHRDVQTYISLFRAGEYIPDDFYQTIRDKVFKEFFQFGILTNELDYHERYDEPIHCVVVPKSVFAFYGNTLCEIEKCLKESKCQESVHEIHSIVPTLRWSSQYIEESTT